MIKKLLSAAMSAVMTLSCLAGMSVTVNAEENNTVVLEKGVAHSFTLGYNETFEFSYTPQANEDFIYSIGCDQYKYKYNLDVTYNGGADTLSYQNCFEPAGWCVFENEVCVGSEYIYSISNGDDWSSEASLEMTVCILNNEKSEVFTDSNSEEVVISPYTARLLCFTVEEKMQMRIEASSDELCWCGLRNVDTAENYNNAIHSFAVVEPGNYVFRWFSYNLSDAEAITATITKYEADPKNIAGEDGELNIYDAIEVAKYIMDMVYFDDYQYACADYDLNGVVNLYDVIAIARELL